MHCHQKFMQNQIVQLKLNLSRVQTILGRNFALLAYGNCRGVPHAHMKSQFREKISVFKTRSAQIVFKTSGSNSSYYALSIVRTDIFSLIIINWITYANEANIVRRIDLVWEGSLYRALVVYPVNDENRQEWKTERETIWNEKNVLHRTASITDEKKNLSENTKNQALILSINDWKIIAE